MLTELLLVLLIAFIIIYALVKGCNLTINVTLKQEFSEEDRKLLEDLYNSDGDAKPGQEQDLLNSLDEAVKSINSIMLGTEEESNG